MTFRFAFKTSFGHLQDVLARRLACLGKTSCRYFFANWEKSILKLKVSNRNTRTKCEICSKLIIKTPEQHQLTSLRCLYCKLDTHFTTCLVFALVTLNMQLFAGQLSSFCEEIHREAAM